MKPLRRSALALISISAVAAASVIGQIATYPNPAPWCTLVRQYRQAIVQPAELGLRSGLDYIVSADGVLGLPREDDAWATGAS